MTNWMTRDSAFVPPSGHLHPMNTTVYIWLRFNLPSTQILQQSLTRAQGTLRCRVIGLMFTVTVRAIRVRLRITGLGTGLYVRYL